MKLTKEQLESLYKSGMSNKKLRLNPNESEADVTKKHNNDNETDKQS